MSSRNHPRHGYSRAFLGFLLCYSLFGNLMISTCLKTKERSWTAPQPQNVVVNDEGLFNGSSINKLSPGMDLIENVCVKETPHQKPGRDIVWYSLAGKGFHLDKNGKAIASWPYLRLSSGKALKYWAADSSKILITDETVLLHQLEVGGNPAHCLSDLVFALGEDMMSRDLMSRGSPVYSHFLYKTFTRFEASCPTNDWCCELMRSTRLIDPTEGSVLMASTEGTVERHGGVEIDPNVPICFKRLLVPRLFHFRYPTDEQARTIQKLHREAVNSLNLTPDPWDYKELPEDVPILLYDRTGARRRKFTRSKEVKRLLEKKYHARVELWGEAWETLNFTEQALLYNRHPLIIAPHGAHLANLFFVRPGTRVVEIQCTTHAEKLPPMPIVNLTSKDDTMDPEVDWYGRAPRSILGTLNWFKSFSRRLSVEHYLYLEHTGCTGYSKENPRKHYSPETFSVDPATFVSLVASRFGLTARNHLENVL